MSHQPQVSIIIPAYNVQNYIRESLESLKNQSLSRFEALIVDDGSTDNTASVVKDFIKGDSRFKLLQKQNGGLSSARNYGIKHAKAAYIALLDGDDTYHPDKLSTHIAVLEEKPQVGIVYSASRAIRDDGALTPIHISGKPIYKDPLRAMLCKNFIGHGSNAIFRRSIVQQVGDFDETLKSCEDMDFWLRIAETRSWKFFRVPKAFAYYRVRPSGLSFNIKRMQQTQVRVMQSAHKRNPETVGPLIPTAEAYMYRYLARVCLASGDTNQANEFIDKALARKSSIFIHDIRSLITLLMVKLSPISQYFVKQTLGSEQ